MSDRNIEELLTEAKEDKEGEREREGEIEGERERMR
jgi:hypothetical protein